MVNIALNGAMAGGMAALMILGQSALSNASFAAPRLVDPPIQVRGVTVATASATIIRAEVIRFETAPLPVPSRTTGEAQRIIVFE